jgi:hypothetical protein
MIAVLYATYLYSTPDRRSAIVPVNSPVDYRNLNTGEERGIAKDEQSSTLEDLPLEKRV